MKMGLSIAAAVGVYGVSFGALATTAGLSVLQTQVLSLLMFTGGSQFAFIGALVGGGPTAVSAAFLLGLRNAVYGAELNALMPSPLPWRMAKAHLTIDESFATAVAQPTPEEQRRGFWTAGLGVFVCWNVFTLVGSLAGSVIGDPRTYGLDGAAVAGFLGLLWPRLKVRDSWAVAVVAAVVTVVLLPFLPPGVPLLVAAGASAAVGLLRRAEVAV